MYIPGHIIKIIANIINAFAAILFILGSVFFLFASDMYTAVWLFIIGSILFLIPPLINLTKLFGFI